MPIKEAEMVSGAEAGFVEADEPTPVPADEPTPTPDPTPTEPAPAAEPVWYGVTYDRGWWHGWVTVDGALVHVGSNRDGAAARAAVEAYVAQYSLDAAVR